MALSKDPGKRRRQLENLARGAERRAATLRSLLDGIEDPIEDEAIEDPAASEDRSEDPIEAGSRIGRGGYRPDAIEDRSEAAIEDPVIEDPVGSEDQSEDHSEDDGPGAGLRLAGRLLGVERR